MILNVCRILFTIEVTLLMNSGAQRQDCFRELELELEIRSALFTLTESLNSLKTELHESIAKVEKRLLKQDENFKNELVKVKEEIIAETERILPYPQLTGLNDVVKINNNKDTDEPNISRTIPSDCKEVQEKGFNSSGPYRIHPKLARHPFIVWCDMKTEKGGWTYLLNRFDGSQNFNLNWTDYKRGFGNISGEHWLGLEHMYELTNSKTYKLLIELVDWESTTGQATYDNFKIGNESEGYVLSSLGAFRGNTGDSFSPHVYVKFSTPDRDQDTRKEDEACAVTYKAGWWFTNCFWSLLTGQYLYKPLPNSNTYLQSAIKWNAFHGTNYSLKETRMMIRPV